MAITSGAMPGDTSAGARSDPCVDRDLDDVALGNPQARGGLRIDLHPAAPHRRRHHVRQFLEPRQVRERAVEKRLRRVGQEMEWVLRGIAVELRRRVLAWRGISLRRT